MTCLVQLMTTFKVVMATFMRICVGSALRVRTRLVIQFVSTGLMTCDASSSSKMRSSWDHLAKGIFQCGCAIGSTVSSISSLTFSYLYKAIPLNTSLCLSRMRCRVTFGVEAVFLHCQSVVFVRGVRIAGIS